MRPEDQHVLSVLKTTMRVLGFNNRDVERQLGLSGSYLSRLFSGDIDLRFSHIVDIARALGLEPEELLQLAYPLSQVPRSEASQRLRTFLEPQPDLEKSREASRNEAEEMEELVEGVIAGMLERLSPVALLAGMDEVAAWGTGNEDAKARSGRRKRSPGKLKE